jgi:Family of unknown function (DUF6677)
MDERFVLTVIRIVGAALFLLVAAMSKKGERIRGAAFFAGWLVPGAGHVMLGQWKKGLFFFAILGATYLFGMSLTGFRPVSFDDNPFYYFGQYGSGAALFLAKMRGAEKAVVSSSLHPSWFDPGLLYVCVAGLLNLVVMLSTLDAKIVRRAVAPAPAAPLETPVLPPVPAPEKPA